MRNMFVIHHIIIVILLNPQNIFDTLLFFGCFWLMIFLLFREKEIELKQYGWFLFIVNAGWLICLLLLKGLWKILDFFIVKLSPSLLPAVIDNFALILIVSSVIFYFWIMARSFKLGFTETLRLFFFSHAFYLLIIFGIAFIIPKDAKTLNSAKDNLGEKAMIKSHFVDIDNITSGKSLLFYLRYRPLHL